MHTHELRRPLHLAAEAIVEQFILERPKRRREDTEAQGRAGRCARGVLQELLETKLQGLRKIGHDGIIRYSRGRTAVLYKPCGKSRWVYGKSASLVVGLMSDFHGLNPGSVVRAIYRVVKARSSKGWRGWQFALGKDLYPNGIPVGVTGGGLDGWARARQRMRLHMLIQYWREQALAPQMAAGGRLEIADRAAYRANFV